MVHFIHETIVTYAGFGYGIFFYPSAPTDVGQNNWEQKKISRSCGKPQCFSNNYHDNCFIIRRAHLQNLSEPVQNIGHGSSSSYDSQPNYW